MNLISGVVVFLSSVADPAGPAATVPYRAKSNLCRSQLLRQKGPKEAAGSKRSSPQLSVKTHSN